MAGEGEDKLDYGKYHPGLAHHISPFPLYYGHNSQGPANPSLPELFIVNQRTHAVGFCVCERKENTLVCVRLSNLVIMHADKPFRQTGRWVVCEITFSFAFQ